MLKFNWESFLEQHNINFTQTKNELLIKCPLCPDDELTNLKPHMSINTEGKGWHCWRDRNHKGGKPHRLIQALTGYSRKRIEELTGDALSINIPTNFFDKIKNALAPIDHPRHNEKLKLPEAFHPISINLKSCIPFNGYLNNRGFSYKQIDRMHERYGLHFCVRGPFKGRIIFPIRYQKQLVTWTGRAITPSTSLRYLTLKNDEAIGPITNYLLWFDDLLHSRAETLCLCEGPFDALKLNEFGREAGLAATCFFTSSPSQRQISLLHQLLPKFKRKILLLDQGTISIALKVMSEFNGLGIERIQLPGGVKDPGVMSHTEILTLAQSQKIIYISQQ